MTKKPCNRQPCPYPARKRGMCVNHYQQARRGTIPMPPRTNRESVVRCDLRIDVAIDEKLRRVAKAKKEPRTRVATRMLEDAINAAAGK